jgi:hypothetical protein
MSLEVGSLPDPWQSLRILVLMGLLVELLAFDRFPQLAPHFVEMLSPFEIGAVVLWRHCEGIPGGQMVLKERRALGCEPDTFLAMSAVSHSDLS